MHYNLPGGVDPVEVKSTILIARGFRRSHKFSTSIHKLVKSIFLRLGYDFRRVTPGSIGQDPFLDMYRLTGSVECPIVFDVGSNRGKTVHSFCEYFPSPVIHAFEPSPSTFHRLKKNTMGVQYLHLNNFALGLRAERKVLFEDSVPEMSSLLEPDRDSWGEIISNTAVDVDSLDSYCEREGVALIDVLKVDTQGHDFAVLQGGLQMLKHHRVRLVFVELIFCDLYLGQAPFEDIFLFLKNLGFIPVGLYDLAYHKNRLGWADALFIDPHMRATA